MSTTRALVSAILAGITAGSLCGQVTQNSNLPRPDVQLSLTPGVINGGTSPQVNTDSGFGMYATCSPQDFLPDRGALVATPRLVYTVHADAIGGNVVLQFQRSTDGGRNFAAPITIYTCNTSGGEDLESGANEMLMCCHGDIVYVLLLTNRDDLVAGGQNLYVIASVDQGLTWGTPTPISSNVPSQWYDIDDVRAVAAGSGLHVTFEWDHATNANGNENFSYARLVATTGGLVTVIPATPITSFPASGPDVDFPDLAVADNTVLISWNDNSDPGLSSSRDQTWSVISFDGGQTFSQPRNHTQFTSPSTWATARKPFPFVDGPYAFVFMEDSRVEQDDVWMDRADIDPLLGTCTWSVVAVQCNSTPNGPAGTSPAPGLDVDGMLVAVRNGVIAVLYRDDRTGSANSNWAFMAVSRNFGADFIAGTALHHVLDPVTTTIYGLQISNNMIAGVWEHCSGDEEGVVALSADYGQNFDVAQYTTAGDCGGTANVDIDDPVIGLSLNGDYTILYADERLTGTNTGNAVFRTGGKYPYLVDLTATTGTLEMHRIDPGQAGSCLGVLFISGGGTSPGHAVLNNNYGFWIGLNPDQWYSLLLGIADVTFRPVTAPGTVNFALGFPIPNLTVLLGQPIDIVGGTFSPVGVRGRSYTDPHRF